MSYAPGVSLGQLIGRSVAASAWDVGGVSTATYTTAAPYTWATSLLVPKGAIAIAISLLGYIDTTNELTALLVAAWDYESAFNQYRCDSFGVLNWLPYKPATAAAKIGCGVVHGIVRLGASRDVKLGGVSGTNIYAMYRGYYMGG